MAKVTFKGIDEYLTVIDRLGGNVGNIASTALYEGAGVMADAIRQEVSGLPTDDHPKKRAEHEMLKGITGKQRAGLLRALSIKPFEKLNNAVVTSVSFIGRNNVKTKMYPNGQPNSLIARSVQSGSTFMVKNPFMDRAKKRKKDVEEAMKETVEKEIERLKKE